LITIAMSKVIRCPRARVWQALVSPGELIRWDTRRVSLDEPIPDYPAPGHRAHWRCAVGGVTLPHVEEPVEVVPGKRLRSSVHLGSFGFEETYTLSDEEPDATRLSLRLATKNKLPLLGGELDRFDVRRLTVERVDDTLHWLQAWCEETDR
jgi:uncharacterized protein YndB with AHSA1/START domain